MREMDTREFDSLEDFLDFPPTSLQYNASNEDWDRLIEEVNSSRDQINPMALPTTPAQTPQMKHKVQPALQWRSEFETPVGIRPPTPAETKTPLSPALFEEEDLFDFDNIDDCDLVLPSQALRFISSQNKRIATELLGSPAGRKSRNLESLLPFPSSQSQVIEEKSSIQPPPVFGGFTTASGKKIASPTKEAKQKAESLFLEDLNVPIEPSMHFVGFSTASGKKISSPSKVAREKAEKLLTSIKDTSPKAKSISISTFSGFQTASGRSLPPPSENSLKLVENILSEIPSEPLKFRNIEMLKDQHPDNRPSTIQFGIPKQKPNVATTIKNSNLHKPKGFRPFIPPEPVNKSTTFPKNIVKSDNNRKYFDLTVPSERKSLNSIDIRLRKPSEVPKITISRQHLLQQLQTILNQNVEEEWLNNHIEKIILKWVFYARHEEFPVPKNLSEYVTQQILYRYERETNQCHRSCLKRIVERDEAPSIHMILFIESIDSDNALILSDGWYSLQAEYDPSIRDLILQGRISVGQKVRVGLCQLTSTEACSILEAKSKSVSIKIHGNSTRPAKWTAKLGKQPQALFTVSLKSINIEGGTIPCIKVGIIRKQSKCYILHWESGKRQTCSQDEYNNLQLSEEATDRVQSVKLSFRLRVIDQSDCPTKKSAIITFWDSNEEMYEFIKEGRIYKMFNMRPFHQKSSHLSLSASKASKIMGDERNFTNYEDYQTKPVDISGQMEFHVQEDYDIQGYIVRMEGGQLWIASNGVSAGKKLVLVKGFERKNNRLKLSNNTAVYIRDCTFLYHDPRYCFPVFLLTEYSEVLNESGKVPPLTDHSEILQVRQFNEFVRSICLI